MRAVRLLSDEDVARFPMTRAIEQIRKAFEARHRGALVAPARLQTEFGDRGALVFTVGGELGGSETAGFRVYDTFHGDSPDRSQLTAVFDSLTGALKGIVTGSLLGAVRTGAIGGLAIDLLARPDATRVGLIGSGLQARTQLEAACAVRAVTAVRIFSRSEDNRRRFADEMGSRLGLSVEAVDDARQAVAGCDILICATTSESPVVDADWLEPGMHVTTVGPKFVGRHETSVETVRLADRLVTDSLQQVHGYPRPFFLTDMPEMDRLVELSEVQGGVACGREASDDITLFISVGTAGTEILLADALLSDCE